MLSGVPPVHVPIPGVRGVYGNRGAYAITCCTVLGENYARGSCSNEENSEWQTVSSLSPTSTLTSLASP